VGEPIIKPIGINDVPIVTLTLWTADPQRGSYDLERIAHALLGAQFTATSMIGMIALAGIIVRNSILLVDFINLEAGCGTDFQQAVIKAAATRAKPIVLTGLAAMLGAFFILDDPIFNGLAVSLIFGIFVSTILTLVVIPVLYYALRWKSVAAGVCEAPGEPGAASKA